MLLPFESVRYIHQKDDIIRYVYTTYGMCLDLIVAIELRNTVVCTIFGIAIAARDILVIVSLETEVSIPALQIEIGGQKRVKVKC